MKSFALKLVTKHNLLTSTFQKNISLVHIPLILNTTIFQLKGKQTIVMKYWIMYITLSVDLLRNSIIHSIDSKINLRLPSIIKLNNTIQQRRKWDLFYQIMKRMWGINFKHYVFFSCSEHWVELKLFVTSKFEVE